MIGMMILEKRKIWLAGIVLTLVLSGSLSAGPGFGKILAPASASFSVWTDSPAERFNGYWSSMTSSHKPGWKSPGKAALLSFLLPGLGEYYVGARGWTRFFLGMEAAALASWYGNVWYAGQLETEYQTYAAQDAGVHPEGKDLQYWTAIGKYDDLYTYNEQRQRDRDFAALYPESDEYYWQWDAHENRLTYDRKRLDANQWASYEVYFQLAVVLNHIVSGINAMRLARRHNRQLENATSWRFQLESAPPGSGQGYYGIRLSRRF